MPPPGGAAPYNMYSMSAPGAGAPAGPAGPPGSTPPPMAGAPSAYGGAAPGIYNRYVAYDAHNNTAAPLPNGYGGPPAAVQSSSVPSMLPQFLGGARPGLPTHVTPSPMPVNGMNAPNQAAPLPASVMPVNRTLTATNPVAVSAAQPTSSGGVSPAGLGAGNATPASTGSASNSAPGSQRLLGNKALSGGEDLFNSTRSGLGSHSGEEEVIITGSSSAVL